MSKKFLATLQNDMEKKSLLKHPFYQMWNKGALPKQALQEYAKQYYHFTEHFPRFVASVYKNCTTMQLRQKIIHNLVEEELGDFNNVKPHAEQWLHFCEALGIKKKSAQSSKKMENTAALLDSFETLTENNFLQGVAAVYAYEMQVSEIARTKKAGLQKWYNINARKGLEFFDTHMEADIEHAKVWKGILENHATAAEQKKIRESFNKSLDAQWAFLDGIMEEAELCNC